MSLPLARSLALLALAACGPPLGRPEILVIPGAQRAGDDGADGPFGAAVVQTAVRTRVTDVFTTDILYPCDDAGAFAELAAPAPVVLLEPGGLVAPERYRWLGAHLATRGYVTVLPSHASNLGIFDPDNGLAALDELWRLTESGPDLLRGGADPDAPVVAAGHSLGGVVAAKQWSREPDALAALVMLASWPAAGDPVDERADAPVLVLVGSTDASAPPADVEATLDRYATPPWYGTVDGLNHYGWTDDASAGELAKDGPLEGDLDALRQAALRVLDPFVDGVQAGDVALVMPTDPDGVEVSW